MSIVVTDDMVDRAMDVLREEMTMPHMARRADYVTMNPFTEGRALQFAALKVAEDECARRNRDLVRRALAAALDTGSVLSGRTDL